jgi:hypothetical protein
MQDTRLPIAETNAEVSEMKTDTRMVKEHEIPSVVYMKGMTNAEIHIITRGTSKTDVPVMINDDVDSHYFICNK